MHACRDLALLAGIAITGWLLHRVMPNLPLPPTTLALGVIAGSAFSFLPKLRTIAPVAEIPLAVGMVLLGAQFDGAAARTVGVIGIVLLCAHWFAVGNLVRAALRLVGEVPRDASLVSVGLTGCGISAILAAKEGDPKTSERARLLAIASTLLVGATGFVLLPITARALGLDATEIARWAGIAMPTTAEAVLVGGAHSLEALRGTGAFRFVVNLLQWIPVLGHARRYGPEDEHAASHTVVSTATSALRRVPAFVWGLALVAAFAANGVFAPAEREVLAHVTNWAFLMALAGVGFATRPLSIAALGWRPLVAATIAWIVGAALLLGAVLVTR